jgi:PIN domain nuclease of toxin-antitoxin system
MSYLLDTHTLIWSLLDIDKIPVDTRAIIQDTKNVIHISVVSFWECSIKFSVGKMEIKGFRPEDLPVLSERNQFAIFPLKSEDVASSHQLPWVGNHKDPFDRILVWQAIQNNLTIISSDADFDLYRNIGLKLTW